MTRAIFVLTVLGGVGLLVAAVWPGCIADVVFGLPQFCFTLPLLGSWFFLLVGLGLSDLARAKGATRKPRWGLRSAGVMFATLGLLWFHVPQRLVFAFYSTHLQGFVDGATTEGLGGRVGPYTVDQFGTDPRGGVYFRTATGPDGLGPDQMSYGFAFRPNGSTTPFGNSRYRHHHLFGGWYSFAVSDD